MRHWTTYIYAIDCITGDATQYAGPSIPAPTLRLAKQYAQNNGMGYLRFDGMYLIQEIPCDKNYEPDMTKSINYEQLN